MNTILWVFVALAGAIILFTNLQDQLPDELGFLKNKGTTAQVAPGQPRPGAQPGVTLSEYQGWTIRKSASAVEFTRPMSATIVVNGTPYAAPEFGVLCDNGRMDMRIDTRMTTTGLKSTAVGIAGLGTQQWDKSTTKNIFPKDSHKLLTHLYATNPVEFKLSYAELGAHSVKLDTSALRELLQALPASCR
jgi:hypothetical protein